MHDDPETPPDAPERELYRYLASCRDAHLADAAPPSGDGLSPVARQRLGRLRGLMQLLDEVAPHVPLQGSNWSALQTTPLHRPAHSPAATAVPVVLGHYRIHEELGRGGMGVVYRGWDPALRRPVAVKRLHPSRAAEKGLQQRLTTEGQVLARHTHPHIVQVYEIGSADDAPFLVMELIDGPTLHERLAGLPLSPAAAAELVETLARAVQHAHDRGIIHRDLKPGNVLLTRDGTPKITDFGLATLVDARAGLTGSDEMIGTPMYMAPEMALGRPNATSAAVDIYGVGTILYEVLTGRPPFVGANPLLVLAQVEHVDPLPPGQLVPGLPRDLETICLKCLRKRPGERYHSAQELADDLRRYREGRPIVARPVGRLERGWRWCQRNRAVATLTAGVVVSLLLGTATAWVLAVAAGREREHAVEERNNAVRSADFARQALEEMSSLALEDLLGQQTELTENHRRYLRRSLELHQRFADETRRDETARLGVAQALVRIGSIRVRLGELDEADTAYRAALHRAEELTQEFPGQSVYLELLGDCCGAQANLLALRGDRAAAEQAYLRSRDVQRRLLEARPGDVRAGRALAAVESNLARLYSGLGRLAEAEQAFRAALALRRPLSEKSPGEMRNQIEIASSLTDLAGVLAERGRLDAALQEHRAAQALFERLRKEVPASLGLLEDMARSHQNAGVLQLRLGRAALAEPQHRQAAVLFRQLTAKRPAVPEYRQQLGAALLSLGEALVGLGRAPEAEEVHREALAVRKALVEENPTAPEYRRGLAHSHEALAKRLLERGAAQDAEPEAKAALALRRGLVGVRSPTPEALRDLVSGLFLLGDVLAATQRGGEAEQSYREALDQGRPLQESLSAYPDGGLELARGHNKFGVYLASAGRFAEAEKIFGAGSALLKRLRTTHPDGGQIALELGGCQCNLARVRRDLGDAAASLAGYAEAIGLLSPLLAQDPKAVTPRDFLRRCHQGRAAALSQLGRHAEAAQDWERILELVEPPARTFVRMQRSLSLARAKEGARATADIEDLTGQANASAPLCLDLARVFALAAASNSDRNKAETLAGRAVEHLRRAVRLGYREAARLRQDADLAALRSRADFAELLRQLEGGK